MEITTEFASGKGKNSGLADLAALSGHSLEYVQHLADCQELNRLFDPQTGELLNYRPQTVQERQRWLDEHRTYSGKDGKQALMETWAAAGFAEDRI
jgi:hypothetical protein